MDAGELRAKLDAAISQLKTVKETVRLGKEKNHRQLRGLRADIARIRTVLRDS